MEIKDMLMEDVEERLSAIKEELRADGADLDALEAEITKLEARKNEIIQAAEERRAKLEKVAEAPITKPVVKEERKMENVEIRNTKAYIDAYAEYIKSGNDAECRALLTENVSGTVAVPEFVYEIVKTAWESNEITRLVRKSYVKGNLKVGFEISGDLAVKHTESASTAVNEENLTLGIVTMIPSSFKKWISISDEALDLRGEAFLRYIYEEITYRIAQAIAKDLLDKIVACGTVATSTQVAVASIKATQISVGLVAQAIGNLSGEATNPVVVMNPATWAAFKAAQAANSFNYDPFEGLPVVKTSAMPTFAAATTGVAYMIVGDFGQGALANFPNGEGVDFKIDDTSKMEYDLVRILGREFAAIEPVACGAFAKVTK